MNLFESTIESPLRFLIYYLNRGGESYLREQFEDPKSLDFKYIPERDIVLVQKILPRNDTRGDLLDDETNNREIELTFPEFVQQEFKQQFEITKVIINQHFNTNGHDQNSKLYRLILLDCLDIQTSIDNTRELNFRSDLNKFISLVLTFAYNKFNRFYPNILEIQRVKRYFKNRPDSNYTGYKLKPQVRKAHLKVIFERLSTKEFVTKSKKTEESLHQFFNGEIPKSKINWDKGLHELKYFIDQIYNVDILEKKKKQQWKYMQDIFICQGVELVKGWNKKHNKLKSPEKKLEIEELVSMLLPRN